MAFGCAWGMEQSWGEDVPFSAGLVTGGTVLLLADVDSMWGTYALYVGVCIA